MTVPPEVDDALVVGGGFYGAAIAAYLVQQRQFKRVVLIEREAALLARASHTNQARVHNGYHYPRSMTTAYRSRINLPKFVRQWPDAVTRDFTKLYAIARRNSKVSAKQFERFCREIGAALAPAGPAWSALFEPRLVEAVFRVEEYAFDSTVLAGWARRELAECGVRVHLNSRAGAVARAADGTLRTTVSADCGEEREFASRYVFNCTYSGLNQLGGDFPGTSAGLKQEITELALIDMPPALKGVGITMMDGPFFSTMPFPSRALHSLSHVRYTPHMQWQDETGIDPYARLHQYGRDSRVDRMLRDVARYVPAIAQARHVESLFEVKTVLQKNEADDGRPILFEQHGALPGCYSILGGKIDNIYDVLERLDAEPLTASSPSEWSTHG